MKKILALILVFVCAFQLCAFATEFKDMPSDWSTSALEAAVKNGLLTGDNGYIRASDNMTRAEMATIMVRACGATRMTDISSFTDVSSDDWFYEAMSKAVAMGAFKGSGNKLEPNKPITRQEAFVVLSRVFGVEVGSKVDMEVINRFSDKGSIDTWAKRDVAAIVDSGYVQGSDGYIKPLDNISRAEFAAIMDRMVKYYIDDAETKVPNDGNVMIRTKDADLTDIATEYSVILGDAIGDAEVLIKDADMTGKLVVRGGSRVAAGGFYDIIAVIGNGTVLSANTDNVKTTIYLGPDSFFEAYYVVGEE